MKKVLKVLPIALVVGMMMLVMVACGGSKVTKENADKIKVGMTYEEVVKILGDEDEKAAVNGVGTYYWFDGADSFIDATAKMVQNKDVKMITVIFGADKKVVSCVFSDGI